MVGTVTLVKTTYGIVTTDDKKQYLVQPVDLVGLKVGDRVKFDEVQNVRYKQATNIVKEG